MSDKTWQDRLTRRIEDFYATDAQFAAGRPDETVSAALEGVLLRHLPDEAGFVRGGVAERREDTFRQERDTLLFVALRDGRAVREEYEWLLPP